MPVNIPVINRIDPAPALAKNDRINMEAKDHSGLIMSQVKQLSDIGDEVGQIYKNHEDNKIEQLSNQKDQEYAAWMRGELQKAKQNGGDPTEYYADLEKRAAEKRNELSGSLGDVSDRVARHVNARMQKQFGTRQVEMDYQRGAQQETYDNNQFEGAVAFKKKDLPKSAGYIQAGNPGSYEFVDSGLNDIKNTIIARGVKKGSVKVLPDDATSFSHAYRDDDGKIVKVSVDSVTKNRIATDMSEGVKNSVDTLINTGRLAEAAEMKEKYKDYIDAQGGAKLEKRFQTAGRKDEAYKIIGDLRALPDDKQMERIEGTRDPELRSELLKIKDADDRRITAMRTRKETANYNTLASSVLETMQGPNPYHGIADLENNPVYKQTWDNMNAKQKKAVHEMVETPKESTPKSLSTAYSLLADEKYMNGATVEDFMEQTAGLSRTDRNKVMSQFTKLQNPSNSQERVTRSAADKMVKSSLLINDTIRKNNYGKLNQDDEVLMMKYQQKVGDWLSDQKVMPSEEKIQAYVTKAVAEDLESTFFKRPAPGQQPAGQVRQNVGTIAAQAIQDPGTSANYKMQFRAKFGHIPRGNDPAFIKFVQDLQR